VRLLTAKFVKNKKDNPAYQNNLNGTYYLCWSRSKLVPRFGRGPYNASPLSVAESENIKVLRSTLVARCGSRAHFAPTNVSLAGLAIYQPESRIVDVKKEPVLALVTGLIVGA
jgi:hypothetical protein